MSEILPTPRHKLHRCWRGALAGGVWWGSRACLPPRAGGPEGLPLRHWALSHFSLQRPPIDNVAVVIPKNHPAFNSGRAPTTRDQTRPDAYHDTAKHSTRDLRPAPSRLPPSGPIAAVRPYRLTSADHLHFKMASRQPPAKPPQGKQAPVPPNQT